MVDLRVDNALLLSGPGRPIQGFSRRLVTRATQPFIAEGVETQEQFRELVALDCDLAQGFLWSRAVEAEKVDHAMENVGTITPDGLIYARIADAEQSTSLGATS